VKRAILALTALLLAFGALTGPASGAKNPPIPGQDLPKGQACADIVPASDAGTTSALYWDQNWTGTSPPPAASPTVKFDFTLVAPSCAPNGHPTTYTVQIFPIYNGVPDTTPAVTNVYTGDGTTQFFTSAPNNYVLPTDPRGTAPQVCIVVTSATGGKTLDVAPDAGCGATDSWVNLDDTSGGAGRGWY
jgi:hypothetical protein